MENELEILFDRYAHNRAKKLNLPVDQVLAMMPERFTWTDKQKKYVLAYLRKEFGDVY